MVDGQTLTEKGLGLLVPPPPEVPKLSILPERTSGDLYGEATADKTGRRALIAIVEDQGASRNQETVFSPEIKKLRQFLGLKVSPLIVDQEERATKREGLINQHLEIRRKLIYKDSKSLIQDEKREVRPKESLMTRISGAITTRLVKKRGITEAKAILRAFEQGSDFREEELMRGLKRAEIAESLRGCEPEIITKALDRLRLLGYDPEPVLTPELIQGMKQVGALSQENFDLIQAELMKCPFLWREWNHQCVAYHSREEEQVLTDEFKGLLRIVEIVDQKGLTPEQERKIEQTERFATLTGRIPLNTEGEIQAYYCSDPKVNPGSILDQTLDPQAADELLFLIEFIFSHKLELEPGSIRDNLADWNTVENLLEFKKEGNLAAIIELAKTGYWQDLHLLLNNREKLETYFQSALRIVQDSEKLGWILTFSELMGQRGPNLHQIELYEKMYAEKEELAGLALVCKSLGLEFADFIGGESGFTESRAAFLAREIAKIRQARDDSEIFIILENYGIEIREDGFYREYKVKQGSLPVLGYLAQQKDRLSDLFYDDYGYSPRATLIEELLKQGVRIPPQHPIITKCLEVGEIDPVLAWENIDLFSPRQAIVIFDHLSSEFVANLSPADKEIVEAFRAKSPLVTALTERAILYSLIARDKSRFSEFVTPERKLTGTFLIEACKAGHLSEVSRTLLEHNDIFLFSSETEKRFWTFFKNQGLDFQNYLLKRRVEYFAQENFDGQKATRDFVSEIRARPESCTTYEALTVLFRLLSKEPLTSENRAMIYLKVAEAHRVSQMSVGSERTEVEAFEELRRAFSGLYRSNMSSFEKIAWRIMQRQLPFTANESARGDMKDKAVQVEALGGKKLTWVHQSVHNYASTHEVEYLEAFKEYLETGESERLDHYRNIFSGDSQVPAYTEEDRLVLLAIPSLQEELDTLIELTGRFYELNPEALQEGMENIRGLFVRDFDDQSPWLKSLDRLMEDVELVGEGAQIDTPEKKKAIAGFCLNVNGIRDRITFILDNGTLTEQQKTNLLVADAALEEYSQKLFTAYKDYLEAREQELTPAEIFESASVLAEVVKAGALSGELPEEARQKAEKLRARFFAETSLPDAAIGASLLSLPVLKFQIDQHWQKFNTVSRPEMIAMLVRMGMTKEEAVGRVEFTDLVEFRKSSMVYVLEPFIEAAEKNLKRVLELQERGGEGVSSAEAYEQALGPNILETGNTDNPEVLAFIGQLKEKRMDGGIEEAHQLLNQLAARPETRAEKLACLLAPSYLDENKLERKYTKLEKEGKAIEFFPITYYGCPMVVVLVDGKRVEDPEEFLIKTFRPPKAMIDWARREGD